MQLLTPEDISQLLSIKAESKNLDFKEKINWSTSIKDERFDIIKDLLAMANTQDGGRIIIGINDANYEIVGLSDEDYASLDQTKINDLLHCYADPPFSCQLYKHVTDKEKKIVIIDVPEFQDVPIICKDDKHSTTNNNKQILKRGSIYIRTDKGSTEVINTVQNMRELLGRALIKRGDELLNSIERLISGKPSKVLEDSEDKYHKEKEEAYHFFDEIMGESLKENGSWEVCVYPTEYLSNRILDLNKIKETINQSEVYLRGWKFPHTDVHGNASNFNKGRQSYTKFEYITEGYRAYKSGLFIWKRIFAEDIRGEKLNEQATLSFINVIWAITEYVQFIKRYYEVVYPIGDLIIEIILHRTKNRILISRDFGITLSMDYISKENDISLQESIKYVDLKASSKEIANQIIKRIFMQFNWDDANMTMINNWQTKLLEKRF